MPRGSAHDASVPSFSRRRSQCSRVAWGSWTTKRRPSPALSPPPGSGVIDRSRLLLYAPSLSAMATIFTIGHSTHEIGAFLELLRGQRIELLADVRRYPGSRRMPWFNEGELAA